MLVTRGLLRIATTPQRIIANLRKATMESTKGKSTIKIWAALVSSLPKKATNCRAILCDAREREKQQNARHTLVDFLNSHLPSLLSGFSVFASGRPSAMEPHCNLHPHQSFQTLTLEEHVRLRGDIPLH